MDRRALTTIAVVLAAILVLGATGTIAYRAGLAQGLTQTGAMPHGHWGYGHHWPHFPLGFPLVLLVLAFLLVRGGLWGRHCRGGGHWRWHDDVPPRFADWHRRAHESMEGPGPGPKPAP